MTVQRYDASPEGDMCPDDSGGFVTIADYEYLEKRFRAFVGQVEYFGDRCQCTGEDGLPLMKCDECPR